MKREPKTGIIFTPKIKIKSSKNPDSLLGPFVLSFILLFLFIFGVGISLALPLSIPVNFLLFVPLCLVLSFWYLAVFSQKKWLWLGCIISAFLLFLCFWLFRDDLFRVTRVISNRFIQAFNAYYGGGLYYFSDSASETEITLALIFYLAVLGGLSAPCIVYGSNTWVAIIMLVLSWGICLGLGIIPGFLPFVVLFLFTIGLITMKNSTWAYRKRFLLKNRWGRLAQGAGNRAWIKGAWLIQILGLFLFLVVHILLTPHLQDQIINGSSAIPEKVAELRNDIESGKLWDKLLNLGVSEDTTESQVHNKPIYYSGEKVLKVSLSDKPETSIYLKGFVGGDYENQRWLAVPEEAFYQAISGVEYEKLSGPEVPIGGYYHYQVISDDDQQLAIARQIQMLSFFQFFGQWQSSGIIVIDAQMQTITVAPLLDDSTLQYIPYHVYLNDNRIPYADAVIEKQSDSFTFQGYPQYSLLTDQSEILSDENYISQLESVYRQYVYEEYLNVPQDGLNQLRQVLEDRDLYRGVTLEEASAAISSLLKDTSYSMDLTDVPYGEDYVEYFMFTQKKGYCTHYASSAVLMYRLMGIPARYITGYRADASDFDYNEETGLYETEVLDSSAHAWVEVYIDGKGWEHVDFTPGTSNSPVLQDAIQSQTREDDEGQDEPTEATEEANTQENETTAKPVQSDDKDTSLPLSSVQIILLLLALSVMVYLTLLLRRKVILKNRLMKFTQEPSHHLSVQEISQTIYQMLFLCNYQVKDLAGDKEYADFVQNELSFLKTDEFLAFVHLAERAAFSKEVISKEESEAALHLYKKIEKALYQELPWFKKLWWRYIKCF